MFRTLYVTAGERLTVSKNWLVVESEGISNKIPVEDIQTIIIDNFQACVSVYALQTLAKHDVNVFMTASIPVEEASDAVKKYL